MTKVRVRLALAALVLILASPCFAHQIKVLASRLFVPTVGDHTTVYLSWGHALPVDDLVDADTIAQYDLVTPDGKSSALKKEGVSMQANVVEIKKEGLHQVTASKKSGVYTIVMDKEGEYQFKRGPKTAVKEGTVDHSFRSLQFAKALIVAGAPKGDAPKPLGAPLEITPLESPADWHAGRTMHFQVSYMGKLVVWEEVRAARVGFSSDGSWSFASETDKKGGVAIPMLDAGTWVVEVELHKAAPESVRSEYDEDEYTATLALEMRPRR